MSKVEHKFVILPHQGPIYPKAGIHGPILTPYKEDVRTIGILLMRDYKVTEVLADGTEVALNLQNFDQDNTGVVEKPASKPEKEEVKPPKVEEKPVEPEAPKTEEPGKNQQNNQKQFNKNQQKQQQQADVVNKK